MTGRLQTKIANIPPIRLVTLTLYIIGSGACFLFPNSYFWDDWLNYYGKSAEQVRASSGPFSGFSPIRLILEGWLAVHWPAGFRIVSLFALILAYFALLNILHKSSLLKPREIELVSALFILAPVNSARFSMTIFMYSISYASFFIGWSFYSNRRSHINGALALLFFIFSFDTASLIFFMIAPLTLDLIVYFRRERGIGVWIRRNLLFISIAPAYWFMEPLLNPMLDPVRANYYELKLSGIVRGIVVLLPILLIVGIGFWKLKWRIHTHRGHIQIFSGVFLTWVAVFPYMTLGHFAGLENLMIGFVPHQSDWDSRHQLLMPLGISIVVLGLINYFGSRNIFRASVPFVALFALLNFTFTQEYLLDSIKTYRITEALSKAADLRHVRTLLVDDQTKRFNARGREIRSYEWDKIFATGLSHEVATDVFRYVDCKNFVPDAIVTITATRGRLTTLMNWDPQFIITVTKPTVCG